MSDSTKFTIICPCCEAALTIDSSTGALLAHEEKAKPLASFDEMVKGLDKQKQQRDQIFTQELSSMKDRDRILEGISPFNIHIIIVKARRFLIFTS